MRSSKATITADDRVAITALIHRYCWLIDSGDFDALGQLFAHADVHYRGGAEVVRHDPDAFAALQRRFVRIYPETGTPRTRHACTNIVITAEATDLANAVSAVSVIQAAPGLPLQIIICASYRDRFARGADGWYFIERRVEVDLVGDLSAHLLVPIAS
jgi:hypothetical protein